MADPLTNLDVTIEKLVYGGDGLARENGRVVFVPYTLAGERVSVAVELRPGAALSLDELQRWAREHLAPYKVPRALLPVAALPRNAMGKVVKPEVAGLFKSR